MNKKCTKCLELKSADQFPFRNKSKGEKQKRCKTCTVKTSREHYRKNKSKYIKSAIRNTNKYRKINRKKIWQYLLEHPCIDCGENDPIVLEFDHLRDKIMPVSTMVAKCRSWNVIKKEIDKCEVRCANCHRRKTALERNYYKDMIDLNSSDE